MTSNEAVTLATDTIHNPAEARHFMAIKPVDRRVRIFFGDVLLADTSRAVRVIEVGRALYDPVLYIPPDDIHIKLDRIDKSTHCPLKGDASYYTLDGEEIAWCYDAPFDFAVDLTGRVAFWAEKVRIEEGSFAGIATYRPADRRRPEVSPFQP